MNSQAYRRGPYHKGSTKQLEQSEIINLISILKESRDTITSSIRISEQRSKSINTIQGLIDCFTKQAKKTPLGDESLILQKLSNIEERIVRLEEKEYFLGIEETIQNISDHISPNNEQVS